MIMQQKIISINYPSKSIAVLMMNDKSGRNALSNEFVESLKDAFDVINNNSSVKVVIFRGNKEIFCSGAKKSILVDFMKGKVKPRDILLPKLILDMPIPVIAAMEGHAVGGGFALGLCADIIIIDENSRYGCNFMNMGFTPGMGTTKLLENVLTPVLAHELLYTGELRKGKNFKQSGCVFNAILPKKEVFPKALAIAERIAEKPRNSLLLLKATLSLPKRKCFEETITMETMMHQITFADPITQKNVEEEYSTF